MNRTIKQTRSDTLRETLADEIISGVLAPGTRLDETSLAERFAVSRTPVREALKQLSAAGLVSIQAHRAAEVVIITAERMSEMFEARAELEALCARLCALRMIPLERRRLERLHRRCGDRVRSGDAELYHATNGEFHTAIYQGSHNSVLAEMAGGLRRRLSPFSRAQFRGPGRLASSFSEHDAVVEAILRGDAEEAYRAMHRHVAVVRQAFSDYAAGVAAQGGQIVRSDAGQPIMRGS